MLLLNRCLMGSEEMFFMTRFLSIRFSALTVTRRMVGVFFQRFFPVPDGVRMKRMRVSGSRAGMVRYLLILLGSSGSLWSRARDFPAGMVVNFVGLLKGIFRVANFVFFLADI